MENKELPNCLVIYNSLTDPNDVDIKMVKLPEETMKAVREMPNLIENVPEISMEASIYNVPCNVSSLGKLESLTKYLILGSVIIGSISLGIIAGFAINKLVAKYKNKHSSESSK